MLIELLMDLVFGLFSVLTLPIALPEIATDTMLVVMTGFAYMKTGLEILGNYVNLPYLGLLFGLVVSADVALLLYRLIMWIIRKIP